VLAGEQQGTALAIQRFQAAEPRTGKRRALAPSTGLGLQRGLLRRDAPSWARKIKKSRTDRVS
jgi:hypothetical protein